MGGTRGGHYRRLKLDSWGSSGSTGTVGSEPGGPIGCGGFDEDLARLARACEDASGGSLFAPFQIVYAYTHGRNL